MQDQPTLSPSRNCRVTAAVYVLRDFVARVPGIADAVDDTFGPDDAVTDGDSVTSLASGRTDDAQGADRNSGPGHSHKRARPARRTTKKS
jgi:hypothetical protein